MAFKPTYVKYSQSKERIKTNIEVKMSVNAKYDS